MRALSFIPARCNCIKQNIFSKFIFKNSKHHGVSPCILFLATFFFLKKTVILRQRLKKQRGPPRCFPAEKSVTSPSKRVYPEPANPFKSLSLSLMVSALSVELFKPVPTSLYPGLCFRGQFLCKAVTLSDTGK